MANYYNTTTTTTTIPKSLQIWQLPYQGHLVVILQNHCKLVVWLDVYVQLSLDIQEYLVCFRPDGIIETISSKYGIDSLSGSESGPSPNTCCVGKKPYSCKNGPSISG